MHVSPQQLFNGSMHRIAKLFSTKLFLLWPLIFEFQHISEYTIK
jgi:hypothetical protein